MDHQTLSGGRDKRVPPGEWIIKRGAADVRTGVPFMPARRGTFIVPDESQGIIHGCTPDPTSGSLRGRRGRPFMPVEAIARILPQGTDHRADA